MKRKLQWIGPHSISSVVPVRIFMYICSCLKFWVLSISSVLAVHFFQSVLYQTWNSLNPKLTDLEHKVYLSLWFRPCQFSEVSDQLTVLTLNFSLQYFYITAICDIKPLIVHFPLLVILALHPNSALSRLVFCLLGQKLCLRSIKAILGFG